MPRRKTWRRCLAKKAYWADNSERITFVAADVVGSADTADMGLACPTDTTDGGGDTSEMSASTVTTATSTNTTVTNASKAVTNACKAATSASKAVTSASKAANKAATNKAILLTNVNHPKNMMNALNEQYKEGRNCDLELRLGHRQKSLHVHKCLIDINMKNVGAEMENDRFYLDLKRFNMGIIECLVQRIYTGVLKIFPTTIGDVLSAALELGHTDAANACKKYITKTSEKKEKKPKPQRTVTMEMRQQGFPRISSIMQIYPETLRTTKRTSVRCCIPNCKSRSRQSTYVHNFPFRSKQFSKWVEVIKEVFGRKFKISKGTGVCSAHFIRSDYDRSRKYNAYALHPWAVPSVFHTAELPIPSVTTPRPAPLLAKMDQPKQKAPVSLTSEMAKQSSTLTSKTAKQAKCLTSEIARRSTHLTKHTTKQSTPLTCETATQSTNLSSEAGKQSTRGKLQKTLEAPIQFPEIPRIKPCEASKTNVGLMGPVHSIKVINSGNKEHPKKQSLWTFMLQPGSTMDLLRSYAPETGSQSDHCETLPPVVEDETIPPVVVKSEPVDDGYPAHTAATTLHTDTATVSTEHVQHPVGRGSQTNIASGIDGTDSGTCENTNHVVEVKIEPAETEDDVVNGIVTNIMNAHKEIDVTLDGVDKGNNTSTKISGAGDVIKKVNVGSETGVTGTRQSRVQNEAVLKNLQTKLKSKAENQKLKSLVNSKSNGNYVQGSDKRSAKNVCLKSISEKEGQYSGFYAEYLVTTSDKPEVYIDDDEKGEELEMPESYAKSDSESSVDDHLQEDEGVYYLDNEENEKLQGDLAAGGTVNVNVTNEAGFPKSVTLSLEKTKKPPAKDKFKGNDIKETGTKIDMDETFWNCISETSQSVSLSTEESTNQETEMCHLGLRRKSDSSCREESYSPDNDNESGRRLRKRKRVDYSKLDPEIDLEDMPVCEPRGSSVSKMNRYHYNSPVYEHRESSVTHVDRYYDYRNVQIDEAESFLNEKQYFPPAAIVPKGCNSRYARGIIAKPKVVTRKLSDSVGHTWTETKVFPQRKTIFQPANLLKKSQIIVCDPKPREDLSPTATLCHPTKPKRPTETIVVCHPTKPVVKGPFTQKPKKPRPAEW